MSHLFRRAGQPHGLTQDGKQEQTNIPTQSSDQPDPAGPSTFTRRRPTAPMPLEEIYAEQPAKKSSRGLRKDRSGSQTNLNQGRLSTPLRSPPDSAKSTRSPVRPSSPRSKSSPSPLTSATFGDGGSFSGSPSAGSFRRALPEDNPDIRGDVAGNHRQRTTSASSSRGGTPTKPFGSIPHSDSGTAGYRSPMDGRSGDVSPPKAARNSKMEGNTSRLYPGVVLGSFAGGEEQDLDFGAKGMTFDGSMEDILDLSAAESSRSQVSGQAGANIAPWLKEDPVETLRKSVETAPQDDRQISPNTRQRMVSEEVNLKESPSRKHGNQALNHFASVPSLPRIKKGATEDAPPLPTSVLGAGGGRHGSHPHIRSRPSSSGAETVSGRVTRGDLGSASRLGSSESVQTLSGPQQSNTLLQPSSETSPTTTRHASAADTRVSRLSSVASNASSTASFEKKKGLFGGFMRRKTAQVGTAGEALPDAPARGLRSTSESLTPAPGLPSQENRLSTSGMSTSRPGQARGHNPRQYSYGGDGAISPLHEDKESEFQLDLNLEDMEGIVDPSLAHMQPAAYHNRSMPQGSTSSESASETRKTGDSGSGPMHLQDALSQTGSMAVSQSVTSGPSDPDSASSQASEASPEPRVVVAQAQRDSADPFRKANPFSSGSSAGSLESRQFAGPSSYGMSPKQLANPPNYPRRPSQLRNVKIGSLGSEGSSTGSSDGKMIQPIEPSWSRAPPGSTLFQDPFGSPTAATKAERPVAPESYPPSRADSQPRNSSSEASATDRSPSIPSGTMSQRPSTVSANAGTGPLSAAAAWAAPESWGVEGDALPDDDDGSSDEWSGGVEELDTDSPSPPLLDKNALPTVSPTSLPSRRLSKEITKPPPFGHGTDMSKARSASRPGTGTGGKGRPKTASGRPGTGRPGTAVRPGTARPGTGGSVYVSSLPHWIRIYRADGSYSTLSFPVHTTTSEMISFLSGATDAPPGKVVTTSMRLYIRERGQDRQLLSSEKPLSIQDRRLRQAGYTEAEHVEELGKEDFAMLCQFIYQTPVLPIMDPNEESSYDSFEFIDIASRDLQTIPIFLHLHADSIIILNLSQNPMTDIPLDFIQACSSLKELRMAYMALKRIPNSICASKTLSRLDVSCNRIADLESVPLHEISTLLSLKVQNNKLTSIPQYFVQMKALKYLNISNNKFEAFPSILCSMSNLVDLDISFNNIAQLPAEMSDLKSLERLAAFGNELTTFPSSFSTLASLRVLDVRRNKLTDLTAIYALPNLATLQADNNDIVTLDAQLGARVREFSVPHNSITRFTLAPVSRVSDITYSLTHLNLSHGKISTLADEALHGLVKLIELKLDFNQFTRLPATIARLVNLEVLSCTDNMLETLPPGIGRLQKLRIINVHNNNLKAIPGEMWACSSLETVNASSNLINGVSPMPSPEELAELSRNIDGRKVSTISEDRARFNNPPAGLSLRYVSLADNRFSEEIFHAIAQCPDLRLLNLSFNDIFEIPPATLSKLDKLEALYLSGNKLTSLPSEDLEKLQKLRILHLNGNKLQTLPSELGALSALRHLDVGSNVLKYNIANWPYDWNWNWNPGLHYLNLSGNKRLEIKPTSLQDMPHASGFRKELSDFNSLTQLRVLGLMDVNIRIPTLPDENEEQRVRTSFSEINNMAYGIADMLGSDDPLTMFDLVVPNFRGKSSECIFGMFGRDASNSDSGKISKFLQDSFATALVDQLDLLQEKEDPTQALRRTFLQSNRAAYEHLLTRWSVARKASMASFTSTNSIKPSPISSALFRTGSSGAVVYLVEKTLHVANVGDCLVVLSRKGEADLLSKLHDPTDREETARIRRAEAWVSTKGYVNDEKDVDISRAVGFYQTFPAINANPEVRTRPLTESDEFVIIGNHALWKWCSYQTAVDIARTERRDPMIAAQKLRDFAISYGAEGSIMVMVVNISDLFYGRYGRAGSRAFGGSEPATPGDGIVEQMGSGSYFGRTTRRRGEEVGDRTLNRLQQEIEPPQGQVAIVFTDIVNSTYLWETNPSMPTAIKMHHNLMRRQLRLDGGYEVKTEGDSFMVSFQTVASALAWAFNCQIGLLSQEWPRELLDCADGKVVYDSEGILVQRGLRVRMGIHWGAPQCERDPITGRMDYYGPMVNRAARINASADGGQLMASQDVISELQRLREHVETMTDDPAGNTMEIPPEMKREVQELSRIGFEVQDMGERKLKGLEVPEKLHLLYPKALSGRFELSNDLRANVEVGDSRMTLPPRHIDIDEVRDLAKLALRLEALCSAVTSPPILALESPPLILTAPMPPVSPRSPSPTSTLGVFHTSPRSYAGAPPLGRPLSQTYPGSQPQTRPQSLIQAEPRSRTHTGNAAALDMDFSSPKSRSMDLQLDRTPSPLKRNRTIRTTYEHLLSPTIRDEMGDDDLMMIMESLTTRIENSLSTLAIRRMGGLDQIIGMLKSHQV